MTIQEILEWQNLLFLLSILLGILFVCISAIGLVPTDFDVDVDVDHDIEVHAHDGDIGHGTFIKVLSIFGIGRCPFSIVLFTALLIFGGTGLLLQSIFPSWLASVYVCVAFVVMTSLTRIISTAISNIMPKTETYNVEPEHFEGTSGKVVITTDETFGQIHVRDQYGTMHKLKAKSYGGKVIPAGKTVLVIEHKNGTFFVEEEL